MYLDNTKQSNLIKMEEPMQYWHMQIHPNDRSFADEMVYSILEHKKIIGLGQWSDGESIINDFVSRMQVNDIVAIRTGQQLIALVQVIGGAYQVAEDDSEIGWIVHRRPIRILDWMLEKTEFSHSRGTLKICRSADAEATKTIKGWYGKVEKSLRKRGVPLRV